MAAKPIRFAPGEPALIATINSKRYVVAGDLHIGRDINISKLGIHVYGTAESMAARLMKIASAFSAERLILLGDIKDSIMHPQKQERIQLARFFGAISELTTTVVLGNHDAMIELPSGVKAHKELLLGRFAFVHGHAMPSEAAMQKAYLVAAHDHPAFAGPLREEKAWVVCKVDEGVASKFYERFNRGLEIISIPAFNPLVSGGAGRSINPLFRNGVFGMGQASIYGLDGSLLRQGTPRAGSEKNFNL